MNAAGKTLRIVVWNCAQALHEKYQYLLDQLHPDIAIIPECAHPDILLKKAVPLSPGQFAWVGENLQKGLGVFCFNEYQIRPNCAWQRELKWILPVSVSGPIDFTLIAVWARYHEAKRIGAPGPVLDFLDAHKNQLSKQPVIMAGDFNSSVKFTSPLRRHELIVANLLAAGLSSAYHQFHNVKQGEELEPTIYWRDRKRDGKTFHIDYCFLPARWCEKLTTVAVGSFDHWVAKTKGDHVPLLIELDISTLSSTFP